MKISKSQILILILIWKTQRTANCGKNCLKIRKIENDEIFYKIRGGEGGEGHRKRVMSNFLEFFTTLNIPEDWRPFSVIKNKILYIFYI